MVDSELLNIFISESREELDAINRLAIQLDKGFNQEIINELLRLLHTLKGNSSLMGYKDFSEFTHTIESFIKEINEKKSEVSQDTINLLLSSADIMEEFLDSVLEKKEFNINERRIENEINKIKSKSAESEDVKIEKFQYITPETIRVRNKDLDRLLNLSSELKTLVSGFDNKNINLAIIKDNFSRISREFQNEILNLRVIPLDDVFQSYPRLIRELSNFENKKIEYSANTNGIKLDRMIVEHINGPMVHLLRNAVDHGIEMPEERKKNGKEETGKIKVSVEKSKESVIITVEDDGKGINKEKIIKKAIEKKLLRPEDAKNLSEKEIINFIFYSGFSTKDVVTEVSGRGVGMDVVKESLRQIGGNIMIETNEGKGTKFLLKLPLSLSIVNCLIFGNKDSKYALPLIHIRNVSDFNPADREGNIYNKQKRYAFYTLSELVGIQPGNLAKVIAVEYRNSLTMIGVENIYEKKEILIKKLDKLMDNMKGIAGATVLDNNQVCFILDANSLLS